MKTGRPVPTLSTVERLSEEIDEYYGNFRNSVSSVSWLYAVRRQEF